MFKTETHIHTQKTSRCAKLSAILKGYNVAKNNL